MNALSRILVQARVSFAGLSRCAGALALGLVTLASTPAHAANDNALYGQVKLSKLHPNARKEGALWFDHVQASKVPWVGSWWAYRSNGISHRHRGESELSPSEKLDAVLGRTDKIDLADLDKMLAKVGELDPLVIDQRAKQNAVRQLRQELARLEMDMAATAEAKTAKRTEIEDAEKSLAELNTQITAKQAEIPPVAIDTATEFERIKHGRGTQGVESWWGHCNAWSAAAIMEPEPRFEAVHEGVTFSPGDVKGLLTEAWMEHNSSFFGSRSYHSDTEHDRKDVSFRDVTPAAFHIFFQDQVGNRDRSFVIDRYTGSQVWNQPVRGFATKIEPLYVDGQPEEIDVQHTRYDRWSGTASERSLGKLKVYPVSVTSTFQWITDGVPHETLNVENINERDTPEEMENEWGIRSKYGGQVEQRTLTYKLFLSKPLEDADAEIVGDGEWTHGFLGESDLHPDFMWQPLAQGPSRRDYENPYVDYERVARQILPATLAKVMPPPTDGGTTGMSGEMGGTGTTGGPGTTPPAVDPHFTVMSTGDSVAIPDGNPTGVTLTLEVTQDVPITTRVTLRPQIAHTWRGDLEVTLTHGAVTEVLKRRGVGSNLDDLRDPIDTRRFNGESSKGTWTLRVVDTANKDAGTVEGWSLEFNAP